MKNKILLLFPDGVGIRNYLYSNVFKDEKAALVLFHNFDAETIIEIQKHTSIDEAIAIPTYKESVKEKFLRELICLSRLYYNHSKVNNASLLNNWNWNQKSFSKKIFYKLIEGIAPFFKKYSKILKLEEKYQKAIRQNPFYDEVVTILKKVEPKVVFCSHQRELRTATIFAAATDLGIKTTTVIYSWDNLPKARLGLRADKYLVWSDYMKKEMDLYYPEIQNDKVIVTGTPQFEFYLQKDRIIDRNDFARYYNLDPNKKWICFSGDDIKTSPYDSVYLEDVVREVSNMAEIDRPQIIFRRCPVDFSDRYDKVLEEFKDIIVSIDPLWNQPNANQNWGSAFPKHEDINLQVNLAYHCEFVVNLGSTMAFDFAIYNKPCFYLNYDPVINDGWSVSVIYQFQHFKSMKGLNAVGWINSKAEIIMKFTEALQGKTTVGPDKTAWLNVINSQPLTECSRLIVNEIRI